MTENITFPHSVAGGKYAELSEVSILEKKNNAVNVRFFTLKAEFQNPNVLKKLLNKLNYSY